ncbi:hypothetical protein [Halosolutus gelatinilyticus]|uniref:hypothetical protein n=1 Tax=Halosolutus gelatinilyticus TaxID=2931975 RepID=UPI001FF24EF8|nr:hypothetical protein [Halosolutus gelatinilyticus]
MSLSTYRLEIEEVEGSGIDADVYGEDDLIEDSTHVSYDDYAIGPDEAGNGPSYTEEVTADVTTIDLQVERTDGGFAFRLLGDRDELAVVRIDDDELGAE